MLCLENITKREVENQGGSCHDRLLIINAYFSQFTQTSLEGKEALCLELDGLGVENFSDLLHISSKPYRGQTKYPDINNGRVLHMPPQMFESLDFWCIATKIQEVREVLGRDSLVFLKHKEEFVKYLVSSVFNPQLPTMMRDLSMYTFLNFINASFYNDMPIEHDIKELESFVKEVYTKINLSKSGVPFPDARYIRKSLPDGSRDFSHDDKITYELEENRESLFWNGYLYSQVFRDSFRDRLADLIELLGQEWLNRNTVYLYL